jgi:hypothetical protein
MAKTSLEWVSDCCLIPREQYFSFIMAKTSLEWVSDCCLIPREQIFSFIMVKTSLEWVSDCCLLPSEQKFSYIIARKNYFSMKWCPFCTKLTCLKLDFNSASSLKQKSTGQKCHPTWTHNPDSRPMFFLLNAVCLV